MTRKATFVVYMMLAMAVATYSQVKSAIGGTAGTGGLGGAQASQSLLILTTSLPNGTAGVPYNATLQASGGTSPYTWAIISGVLPPGLSLNATTGAISGTPGNNPAVYAFTVQVTDSSNPQLMATQPLTITIGCPTLSIATSGIPPGTVGTAFSLQMQALGGVLPINWTVSIGSLPPGLAMPTSGLISGTPTQAGSFTFTIQAQDSCPSPGNQIVTAQFTQQINTSTLAITTNNPIPTAFYGQAFSTPFSAIGGTPPYVWTVPAGLIPSGAVDILDYAAMPQPNRNNFHMSGGSYKAFRVDGGVLWWLKNATGNPGMDIQLYDANNVYQYSTENGDAGQNCSPNPCNTNPNAYKIFVTPVPIMPRYFNINGPPVTITTNGANNIIRTTNCGADNQPLISIGNIQGVTQYDGVLSWGGSVGSVPTVENDYYWGGTNTPPFNNRERRWFAKGFGWIQWDAATWNGTQWIITQGPILNNIQTAGGAPTPNFACGLPPAGNPPTLPVTGTVPPGNTVSFAPQLDLVDSTGILSGTPNTVGTFNYTVQVEDSVGNIAQTAFTQTVACVPLSISTANLPNATQNQPYSVQMVAQGGQGALTWSATGLPTGLSISTGGLISGTPTGSGNFTVNVSVTDSCPGAPQTAMNSYTLVVNQSAPNLQITNTDPLPDAIEGMAYSNQMNATGGVPPYFWALINGSTLPAGLSLNATTGLISGTATTAGLSTPDIQVHDSNTPPTFTDVVFQLTVDCPTVNITNSNPLPVGTVGANYSVSMTETGGILPLTWSATGLPPGLSINASTGVISGTPTQSGGFTPTITLTDSCVPTNTVISKQYNLQINTQPLAITTTSPLPNGRVGVAYSTTMSAVGGVLPYVWSVIAGNLPNGLNLNSSSGLISGTPTAAGTFTPTIQVKDAANNTASGVFSITITTSSNCGPPSYPCTRNDLTTVVNPPVPPQIGPHTCIAGQLTSCGNLTGANTIVQDDLGNGNRIVRLTDSTWSSQDMNTSSTGSAIVNQWNLTSTFLIVQNAGTGSYIVGFNPTTMQATFHSLIPGIPGGSDIWSFSFINANLLYRVAGSTPQILTYDLTGYTGGPFPSPTVLFNFDNPTCLQLDSNWNTSRKMTSKTILTMSHDDQNFGFGVSNAGGQGTAIFGVTYRIGSGCRYIDTQTGQVGGDYGTTGTITTTDRWTIHEVVLGAAGDWAVVGFQKCTSGTCSKNPYFWNVATATVNTPNNLLGGHWDTGYTHWMNNSGSGQNGNAQMQERLFTALTTPTAIIPNLPNIPSPFDQHYSWNNNSSASNDGYANFTTIWTTKFPFPSAWCNEILGVFPQTQGGTQAGTVKRFTHSFITAQSGNFTGKYGIGYQSQDGRFYAFTSDWLGTMGSVGGASSCTPGGSGGTDCRVEVFVVEER